MSKLSPDYTKICQVCGQSFHPTSTRQMNCNRPIKVPCVICGNLMDRVCSTVPQKKTCSDACGVELIKRRQVESGSKLTKKCKCCGKEFHPRYIREEYCEGPHYSTCELCGKQFEYDPHREPNKTCSDECRYILAQQHTDKAAAIQHQKENLQAKYGEGVENPFQIPGVIDKIKETNKQKYGVEWYTQTDDYIKKYANTVRRKYGVRYHLQSPQVIAKRIDTVRDRYGVDNVFQSEKIKSKIKQTSKQKYGVEHPIQSQKVKAKLIQTNQNKYGANSYTASWNHRESIMVDPSKSENYKQFLSDPEDFISAHFDHKPNIAELKVTLGVSEHSIEVFLTNEDKLDLVEHKVFSYFEEELIAILKDIKPDLEIQQHNRFLISPYELDVYLPEYNVAIEMNPTGTHNSTYTAYGDTPLPSTYHKMKTDLCEASGIHLFHIFGYEWAHKKNIITSMLRNILGCSDKIHASKCKCCKVSSEEAKKFLENNHLKGYSDSNIHYGLYNQDELIQVIAIKHTDRYEITRLASKLNTCVVGGASKLFKQFISEYSPTDIITTSDRAYASSKLYYTLGFKEVSINDEQGVWIRNSDNQAIEASEVTQQMVDLHKCIQVFDSGTITWDWKST